MQLRRIVDQLMYWALRIFKPWVTECLKHWYREETEGESEEETEEESEEETEEESEEGAEGGTDRYEIIVPIKSENLTCENAEQLDQKG